MIGELLAAIEARLADHDLAGLREVTELAEAAAHTVGLAEPRVTSGVLGKYARSVGSASRGAVTA